jgi:hypothetical protein
MKIKKDWKIELVPKTEVLEQPRLRNYERGILMP